MKKNDAQRSSGTPKKKKKKIETMNPLNKLKSTDGK